MTELETLAIARAIDRIVGLPTITDYEARMIAEGFAERVGYDPDDVELRRDAWQLLINTGACWCRYPHLAATASALIATGECTR